ncbi:hypothetical protein K9O30_06335 [Clostridium bowmanii]|uniref:hypothetical protein n=1 Tax=Clostridium bowmanii TaxID=132925 RepID=UPI001C0C35F4|nr:hypothetical protein [Clostridium bowmanii]MBU3188778.1 hypothetical protein [Clostridium bowmanii]MCA1073362.1 hypothetical protein [Clostridium bowmanii]
MDEESFAYEKDDLYQTLDRINLWIENSDTKTSIAIGAIGVVFAILLSKDYAVKFKNIIISMINSKNFFSFLYLAVLGISIYVICKGCHYLFKVLVPRTDMNLYKESGIKVDSSIFFSTIANTRSYKDFKKIIGKSTKAVQRNDLISQIYICSKICDLKFKNYKRGITLVSVGFIIFVIVIIIGLIIT